MKHLPQLKRKGTLSDRTYEALKNAIMELTLSPGELLLEEEISELMGVSRTPIHSAINRLALEGWVVMIKGRGTYVAELTEKQFEDILNVRKVLEALAIRLAANAATENDLKKMERILEAQKNACSEREPELMSFLKMDVEFHKALAAASGNVYLKRQLDQVLDLGCRYIFAYTAGSLSPQIVDEHHAIYEQLVGKNDRNALKILTDHINGVEDRILSDLRNASLNK